MGASDYNAERVTKGFAKGLLARIALFAGGWSVRDGNQFPDNGKVERYPNTEGNPGMAEVNGYYIGRPVNWRDYYEIAAQQCAELIGDPENPHQLDPDYGDIWKTVCADQYNKYNENMFEVANGVGYSGDIGTLMGASDGWKFRIRAAWLRRHIRQHERLLLLFVHSDGSTSRLCLLLAYL